MKRYLLFLFLFYLLTDAHAQPGIIAHRGYWRTDGSAQNSLSSLFKADTAKFYGTEFDVWRTKEGRYLVSHNRHVKLTDIYADPYLSVNRLTLKNGEQLPTLEAYLHSAQVLTTLQLVLELKPLPTAAEEDTAAVQLVEALKKHHLLGRTTFISFSLHACLTFKHASPSSPVYYLGGNLPPRDVKKLGLDGIDYSVRVLRRHRHWISDAHALGLKVNVWTVNRRYTMRHFIRHGVDFITTDRPYLLQQLLNKSSQALRHSGPEPVMTDKAHE